MKDNKNYYVSKDNQNNEVVYLELDKIEGYEVNPKTKKQDEISVNKIIFVNNELSEKIIRRKIDKKIELLLQELRRIDEEGTDEGTVERSLMTAEKLRLQIINNYVKYLGHTYESLTLKKIQIIVNELRFKLFTIEQIKRQNVYYEERENRRGR